MLAPLPPLLAYRLDRARSTDAADLSSLATPSDDGRASDTSSSSYAVQPDDEVRWVRTAVTLDRAARSRGAERDATLRQFLEDEGIHTLPEVGIPYVFIETNARKEALQMEDWAFLRLAHTTLAALFAVLPDAMILERGRVLAQRARVARHLGAIEAARMYYEEVDSLGIAGGHPELTGRALVGRGILAQLAGNFPMARTLLTRVLSLNGAAADSIAVAHQGLMVAAAEAGDFDRAVQHAWSAFSGADGKEQQTAMLVDLAQILLIVGQPAAALGGFASALTRRPSPRSALPALGGTALAAVGAKDKGKARGVVRFAATQVETIVAALGSGPTPMLPYQGASALVEASEALNAVGEGSWSRRCAAHAAQIAAHHSFHQLSHRIENPPLLPTPSVTPTPVQIEIAQRVEMLEGAELVGVGV